MAPAASDGPRLALRLTDRQRRCARAGVMVDHVVDARRLAADHVPAPDTEVAAAVDGLHPDIERTVSVRAAHNFGLVGDAGRPRPTTCSHSTGLVKARRPRMCVTFFAFPSSDSIATDTSFCRSCPPLPRSPTMRAAILPSSASSSALRVSGRSVSPRRWPAGALRMPCRCQLPAMACVTTGTIRQAVPAGIRRTRSAHGQRAAAFAPDQHRSSSRRRNQPPASEASSSSTRSVGGRCCSSTTSVRLAMRPNSGLSSRRSGADWPGRRNLS